MPTVTAAPGPIVIDGVEYRYSPLSDRDIDELDEYVRSKFIEMARKSLPEDATHAEREETLAVAFREARRLTWMSGAGADLMRGIDGISRVAWMSLRKCHPELTHLQVRAWITSPAMVDYLTAHFKEKNFPRQEASTPEGSPKVRGRPRRSRRST